MTQTERTRFIFLLVLLVILIAAGVVISRLQRQGQVGADILGVIENQAVATYKSTDGLELNSLSSISRLTVSSGVTNLTINYKLGAAKVQNSKFDVQFFNSESGELVTTLRNQDGQQGVLKIVAKHIGNGVYDIAVKPTNYLSQSKKSVSYNNGQPTVIDFESAFKWGDISIKRDNVINNADWSLLLAAWGQSNELADYNGDGVVNNADAVHILSGWFNAGEKFQPEAVDVTPSAPPVL